MLRAVISLSVEAHAHVAYTGIGAMLIKVSWGGFPIRSQGRE